MANSGRPILLFCLLALICFAADIGSKYAIFAWIDRDGPLVFHEDYFQFDAKLNQGGMWSIGAGFGAKSNTLLACFSGVVAAGILLWAWMGLQPGEKELAIVLGVILGGALGNLYDRLKFEGVRDFIEVHYKDVYYYPTFNLADSFLVCGALYMVWVSLIRPSSSAPTKVATPSAAPPQSG